MHPGDTGFFCPGPREEGQKRFVKEKGAGKGNCFFFGDCVIITLAILMVDTSCECKEWVEAHSLRFVAGV